MLSVRGLVVSYGPVRAVHGIDLEIASGELVALIGANGAGKTTTLAAIAGVVRPTAGEILYDGRRVGSGRPHRLARAGLVLVPEGRRILGRLTVRENLLLACSARRGRDGDATRQVYDLFPTLEERKKQNAGTLSGGEQQMLAIGRALVARPRLLMMDEPSLGLAPLRVREVFRAVARLKEEGTTILLVEQNARAALAIADRAYVIETGRIKVAGTPAELLGGGDILSAYLGRVGSVAPRGDPTIVVPTGKSA